MILRDWTQFFTTFTGMAMLAVLLLPVSALVVVALARYRRARGVRRGWAWRSALAEVGIVHGTVPFVWMTMLPGSGAGVVPGRLSLVPLGDLPDMGWPGIGGNLLVLASLGFFGPMRFAVLASFPRIVGLAASCSALIEILQYALQLDRVSSVDDVLVNTAGAGLAALASRRWWRRPASTRPHRPVLTPVGGG